LIIISSHELIPVAEIILAVKTVLDLKIDKFTELSPGTKQK